MLLLRLIPFHAVFTKKYQGLWKYLYFVYTYQIISYFISQQWEE